MNSKYFTHSIKMIKCLSGYTCFNSGIYFYNWLGFYKNIDKKIDTKCLFATSTSLSLGVIGYFHYEFVISSIAVFGGIYLTSFIMTHILHSINIIC